MISLSGFLSFSLTSHSGVLSFLTGKKIVRFGDKRNEERKIPIILHFYLTSQSNCDDGII